MVVLVELSLIYAKLMPITPISRWFMILITIVVMGGINQLKTGDLCWPNWFMATITRFYGEYIELLNGVNINQQTYCGWLRNPNPQLVDGKAPVRIP